MFNQIFVPYLVGKNLLTASQAQEVLEIQKNTRVRIGVLAEEENLMTSSQVDEVNNLQATMNKRFGDIAIEKGYLTKEQLESLLGKQPREHIILKQILGDKQYLDAGKVDTCLNDFKVSLGVSDDIFEKLQDNDVDVFVSYIAKIDNSNLVLQTFARLFVNTVIRLVEREVTVKEAYPAKPSVVKHLVKQEAVGDARVTFAYSVADTVTGKGLAEAFAKFGFDDFDEDAQDSMQEFLNCVSGLVISELANNDIMDLDLEPPLYCEEFAVDCDTIVLPLSISAGELKVFIISN